MKKIAVLSTILSVHLLVSCSSVINGTNQNITVLTSPIKDAQCALKNDKGRWTIPHTPGMIQVHRSDKKLIITCEKEGLSKNTISIQPTLSNVVYGNLLFGGVIGGAIDRNNGSAYAYPTKIKVPLKTQK